MRGARRRAGPSTLLWSRATTIVTVISGGLDGMHAAFIRLAELFNTIWPITFPTALPVA